MGLLVALMLSTAELSPRTATTPEPPAFLRWAVTLGAGFGQDLVGTSSLWGDVEASLRVLRWLRVDLSSGAAWVPFPLSLYPGAHGPARGAFRALAGADFLAPLPWGQLFLGVAGGLDHTNLLYEVFDSNEDPRDLVRFHWFDRWCLVARAGIEVHASEHLALGGSLSFFLVEQNGLGGEVHGRVSFLF